VLRLVQILTSAACLQAAAAHKTSSPPLLCPIIRLNSAQEWATGGAAADETSGPELLCPIIFQNSPEEKEAAGGAVVYKASDPTFFCPIIRLNSALKNGQ